MIKKIGSQTREPIEETEYELLELVEYLEYPSGRDAILLNKKTGAKELFTERDDFAGYVIEINGTGFEFIRQIK